MLGFAPSAVALPAKFYGLQSPYATSAKNMKIVGHSGAEYFRVNFTPSMSHSEIETIFDLALRNGLTIFPDVYGGKEPVPNACALAGNGWRELAQYLASFYGPGGGFWSTPEHKGLTPEPVEAIEIWNEPNRGLNSLDGIKAAPAESAYFVNQCADAIHAVAPNTKVIMGGLLAVGQTGWVKDEDGIERYNYTVHDFLEVALNLERTVHYDGVALHPYAFKPNGNEATYERIGKNITSGREAVNQFVSSGMPVWITEVGWPSWGSDPNHATVAEPERAGVLADTFTWIENHQASDNIQSLIYYNYRDFGQGVAWDRRCGLLSEQPGNRGIDDAGNVLAEPFSGSLFTGAWTTYKDHAGGDPFYPSPPLAATNGATFVTASSARLQGYYNVHELQSEYQFEWGPTPSYGNSTPRHNAGFDNSNHEVVLPGEEKWGQLITGLSPNTTYHFRLVVRNENGESAYGADQTFTTKEPPSAITNAATNIAQLDAVLNGKVNPKEEVTEYFFEYGPSAAYGSTTPVASAGYGNQAVEVHEEIAGLQYGVTYHFRVVASNYLGTSKGEDKTFTPAYKGPAPAVSTRPASQIADTTATLNGQLSPNGLETRYFFEYGPTTSYGSKTPEEAAGAGSMTLSKSAAVSKLNPNGVYHYRMVATNSAGTTLGSDRTFLPGWTIQPSSKAAGFLEDVSCSAANDCIAVGHSDQWAISQHWNGSEWTEQAVGKPAGATMTAFYGVSCISSSACTAVGYSFSASTGRVALAEEWNGSEWKVQSTENPPASSTVQFRDVSCASASECVAVGSYFSSEDERALIESSSAGSWKIETSRNGSESTNRLMSVSCPSSSFCMAVGFYESAVSKWLPLTESRSGGTWTQRTAGKPASATNAWLYGVSCTSSTACTAVGRSMILDGNVEEFTLAERWEGSMWAIQETPNPESMPVALEDISCTTGSACTAVGYYWDRSSVERPLVMAWNGASGWSMQAPLVPAGDHKAHPEGISCVVSRGCELVGFQMTAAEEFLTLAEGYWRGPPPTASTEAATVIGDTGATLNASVNPNGSETKYFFEYGTTTSYGLKTSEASAGSGTSPVLKSQATGGLSPNTTYHYRVVATNENPDPAYGADQTFNTTAAGTAAQLAGMAVTEPFNGSSGSLASFSANWSTLGWATSTSPKGEDTTAGWRPVNAYPTVNGAFYNPVITDTGQGVAAVATMATNPGNAERHFSVWLDMPSPSSTTRAGYELRFTDVSTGVYSVTLAKWQAGAETVLASKSSYGFANGNSFALLDQGGTISAWTNTGSGFSRLLSASDASFSGGNAGIQGAGNITRLTNFKAGALLTPVTNMDAALKALPVNDAFATNESPLSGGGAWAGLAWDNGASGHNTGRVEGGWGPYDANPTINGAYWQKASFADSGAGDAVAALLYSNPTIASRYFSLWLNAPSPASVRSGYELRLTETSSNVYEVVISKWQSGTKTVLASKTGYSFPTGSQFALADKAGMVSAWTRTGSEYTQLLSAADSTFINGYTGIEGSGNITRLKEFRSGPLAPF